MITLLQLRPYTSDVVAPSPNHGVRKAQAIEGIVLHATQDAGNESRSLSWLRSPRSQASCHLLVGRDGRVTRLVGDQQRAWHAGAAQWRGKRDVNSVTLGVEIANRNDGEPYTDAQYARVADIVAHYCSQGLSLEDVVAHGEIAPRRRSDPLGWDWDRFRALVQYLTLPAAVTADAVPTMTKASAALPQQRVPAAFSPPPQRVPAAVSHKPVVCSRTLWLNAVTVLAALAAILGESLELAFWAGVPVPEVIAMWALFALGVVNIILRFWTSQPICGSAKPQPKTSRRFSFAPRSDRSKVPFLPQTP